MYLCPLDNRHCLVKTLSMPPNHLEHCPNVDLIDLCRNEGKIVRFIKTVLHLMSYEKHEKKLKTGKIHNEYSFVFAHLTIGNPVMSGCCRNIAHKMKSFAICCVYLYIIFTRTIRQPTKLLMRETKKWPNSQTIQQK